MRQSNDYTHNEENVSHRAERQRRDNAADQYQHLQRGCFGFLRSQGKNTPFIGYELPGRVRYTLVGGKVVYEGSSAGLIQD